MHTSVVGLHTWLLGQSAVCVATAHALFAVVTMAPTPPEMPRTLASKSAISSLMADQLRMR